jgi:hypothetical protein
MIGIKADFLNAEQKKLKQNIMEGLMDGLFGKINRNIPEVLDHEAVTDMLISCIIMFTRDSVVNFVRGSNMNNSIKNRKDLVDTILGTIKNEIMENLKEIK